MQTANKRRLPKTYQKHRKLVVTAASFLNDGDLPSRNEFLFRVYRACRVLRKLDEEELRHIKLRKHAEGTFSSLLSHFLSLADKDRRLASKWAAALKYAQSKRVHSDKLSDFIADNGGINSCGALLRELPREKRRRLSN